MIYNPLPFEGLNIIILFIIPIKGSGFIDQGSGLGLKVSGLGFEGLRFRV